MEKEGQQQKVGVDEDNGGDGRRFTCTLSDIRATSESNLGREGI